MASNLEDAVRDRDDTDISALVCKLQNGDLNAREELIRATLSRLERLARQMLRRYPAVRRWEDTMDVLNAALFRLDRALHSVTPASSRGYFGLAAEQLRRTLLDLARHYQGAFGLGRHHDSRDVGGVEDQSDSPRRSRDEDDLDRWVELHEAVGNLPVAERETFMLSFYHDWTQGRIAELFQVDERTVRRRWQSAVLLLSAALGGDLPGG